MPDDLDPPELPDAPVPSPESALAADATGAQATELPPHSPLHHTHCQNCGTELSGPFCHRCGQHDFDINQSFGHTFLEALENFFHFDTKLFRNVVTLLFQPGCLTADFNAGKRASQMPPFRFYVFVSFLFFFLAFLGDESDRTAFNTTIRPDANATLLVDGQPVGLAEAWDSATKGTEAEMSRTVDKVRDAAELYRQEQIKQVEADKSMATENAGGDAVKDEDALADLQLPEPLQAKARQLMTPEGQQHMLHGFIVAVPKILLFCLPLFALYTRILFRKSGRHYLQHLVLALHFHTFVFLWVMVRNGWGFIAGLPSDAWEDWVHLVCNLWLAIYPVIMLRRMFANSWPMTLIKSALLAMAYTLTIGLAFLAAGFVIVLLL